MMMRVCTRAGLEKYQPASERRRGKFSSIEWKTRERKVLCIELRNFLSQANLFLCYFWHLFMTKKLFVTTREYFPRDSADVLIEQTARTDTVPLVHIHFADFFLLSRGTHKQPRATSVLSSSQSYDTGKKYSTAIKALANYFFSWNEVE